MKKKRVFGRYIISTAINQNRAKLNCWKPEKLPNGRFQDRKFWT